MRLLKFLRDWALIISIIIGVISYLVYSCFDLSAPTRVLVSDYVAFLQPALIFAMLYLSLIKVDLKHLRFRRWHLWLLLFQCGIFAALSYVLTLMPYNNARIILEGLMICIICPTATAAAVIVRKLDGNMPNLITYTILINLAAAVLIPALLPYVHPKPGLTSFSASLMILSKVFPLLLVPLILAFLTQQFAPRAVKWLAQWPDAAFWLWVASLVLSMAVSTRSALHTHVNVATMVWLAGVALASCALQFAVGWRLGASSGDRISAGQALGQKNTAFAIWLGYTFFTPVTSIAGGFYVIGHNVINSVQLYLHERKNR